MTNPIYAEMTIDYQCWSAAFLSAYRHTISEDISYQGIGVHSGLRSLVKLSPYHPPTEAERGVVINGVPLKEWRVSDTLRSTTIKHPIGGELRMTEHLFAALYAAGIDDVLIEVTGHELPILDGSALEYIKPIKPFPSQLITKDSLVQRGPRQLPSGISLCWLESELCSSDRLRSLSELPLSAEITLEIPPIPRQSAHLLSLEDLYLKVIPAKTFGLLTEEAPLRSSGLIKGVSHDNTRVYDQDGQTMTPLPFEAESAYHKLLDLIGDLYLVENRLIGHLKIKRGGHHLYHLLINELKASVDL